MPAYATGIKRNVLQQAYPVQGLVTCLLPPPLVTDHAADPRRHGDA